MGKRCKVLIVAIMIAAIAVSGGITTLGSANADETSSAILDTAGYVTVNGATVTAGADSSGTVTHKGLLVATENNATAYSGNINGIFKGNSSFTYSFPGVLNTDGSSLSGKVTLRISDVSDENNYFDIVYYRGGWYGHAVVKYGDQYRGTRYYGTASDGDGLWIYDIATTEGETLLYHWFGQNNATSNAMSLEWDDNGILKVLHTTFRGDKRELARFDGTVGNGNLNTNIKDEAEVRYGLPKISFTNGYKVSFISEVSGGRVSPLLLESITTKSSGGGEETVSFEEGTVGAEPSWFTEYAKIPQISLGDNVIKAKYKDSFTVPAATYSFPARGGSEAFDCAKTEYSTDDGATWTEISDNNRTLETAGAYKLRYTAVENSVLPGNTAEYSFVIMDEYFGNANVVSVDGATITAGADSSGSVTHKGLLVSANEEKGSYNGKINGILTGDTTINFNFVGTLFDGKSRYARYIDFKLRITDATDSENYFDIVWFNDGWNSWYNAAKVVDKNGNQRTTRRDADSNGNTIYTQEPANNADNHLGLLPYYGGDNTKSGKIELKWVDDILEVHALTVQENDIIVAKFDGTEAVDNTAKNYGLAKIAFPKGYVVTFSAGSKSGEKTVPLLLESVVNGGETLNLEEEIIEASATPAWYTAYLNAPQITIDGKFDSLYTTVDGITVPSATFVTLADNTVKAVAKTEYSVDNGAFEALPADRKLTAKGNYVIRYTAVEGSASAGNVIERSFRIADEWFDMTEVVTADGATVTAGADKSGKITHKGLLVEPEAGSAPYTAKINGVFNGNSSVTFAMAGELVDSSSKDLYYVMNVFDVNDDKNGFKIYFYKQNGGWYVCAAVGYDDGNGEVYRTTRQWDGLIKSDQVDGEAYLTWFAAGDKSATKIDLSWDSDGVLAVTGYGDYAANGRILAKFDGTDAIDNDNKYFGLPKLAFTNGYRISFEALPSLNGGTEIAPLLLEEINGVSLADKVLAPEKMALDTEACALLGAETVTVNGTNDNKTAEELGLGARFPYSVAFGSSFTVKSAKTIYATVPALNEYASTPLSYTYLSKTLTQTLTVVNAAPVVSLNVEDTLNFRLGGPNASSLTLRYTDVTATDLVDGKEGVTIKIYVKSPSSAFTEVADGSAFEPTEIGEYTIKYVAIDKDNIASDGTLRTIVVIDGKVPVITVADIADTALIKSSITVPAATATDGGDENVPLEVTFKVVYKVNATDVTGEELNVAQGGKLTFDRAGTYVIVYYAIDADGNEIDKTFTVTVLPDTDRPVLTVEGGLDDVTATKGEEVTVRAASATDEVDGNVNVTVKVAFGVTEIAVADGKFVAENEGVYTVTYTATDEAGNTIEKSYSITVAAAPAPAKKGCGSQTARDLAIMLGSLSVMLGAALFIGKK